MASPIAFPPFRVTKVHMSLYASDATRDNIIISCKHCHMASIFSDMLCRYSCTTMPGRTVHSKNRLMQINNRALVRVPYYWFLVTCINLFLLCRDWVRATTHYSNAYIWRDYLGLIYMLTYFLAPECGDGLPCCRVQLHCPIVLQNMCTCA